VDTFCREESEGRRLAVRYGDHSQQQRDTDYWRVRLGKKFTGGNIVTRNFEALADARRWIFGDARKLKTVPMPAVDLRRLAEAAAFELSSAEIAEATTAIRKCRSAGITLHAAVDYGLSA
jgi:hypothetical protein